ncbi:MAG: DUF2383 domain-containing protein [Deltaproteobacteria bacterium]|nr:DUF2383 domain-containing protein [Deltaproteobacteria bacterium]
MATKSSVEQLNSFLRGEMSAVETYQMAIDKIDHISTARDELLINLKSHQDRVMMLRDAIVACGGTPAEGSGPWGVFAKAVEGGAKVFGEKAAVAMLEEGEDHGLADYKRGLDDLEPVSRSMVSEKLLPQQQLTHDRVSALKKRV